MRQTQAIPLALEGKDLLVKAKTGSGKTAAYAIPMLHKILKAGSSAGKMLLGAMMLASAVLALPFLPLCGTVAGVKALVLVPTRELCDQTREAIKSLMYYCMDVCTGKTAGR